MKQNIELPQVFSALADPTRFAIVEQLMVDGEQTVGELAKPFDMSAPAISRHIRVLEGAGLVERRIEKQWRVCRLRQECFSSLSEWLKRYQDFWEGSLNRLDTFLSADTSKKGSG